MCVYGRIQCGRSRNRDAVIKEKQGTRGTCADVYRRTATVDAWITEVLVHCDYTHTHTHTEILAGKILRGLGG